MDNRLRYIKSFKKFSHGNKSYKFIKKINNTNFIIINY